MAITCLEDQLRRDESERQFAYDDSNGRTLARGARLVGNLTIGVGRNLSAKGLSEKERAFLLANDISDATAEFDEHFPWTQGLDAVRRGALLNLVFNLGAAGLAGFPKMLAALQARDWATAATELKNSAADHQEPARIERLAMQIETGFWQ
jgi:lysozyme